MASNFRPVGGGYGYGSGYGAGYSYGYGYGYGYGDGNGYGNGYGNGNPPTVMLYASSDSLLGVVHVSQILK